MKSIRWILSLMLVSGVLTVIAGQAVPPAELRSGALERLGAFVEKYPDAAVSERARELLKRERENPDSERWIGDMLRFSRAVLKDYPPQLGHPDAIRHDALEMLDFPLGIEDSDPAAPAGSGERWRETVNRVYQPLCDAMIDEIAAAEVKSGARVWKVYNMGFIVKTRHHTWGFDVRSGDVHTRRFTSEQLMKLTALLDVLLISHNHLDHVGADLAAAMLKVGKPVIRPTAATLAVLGPDANLKTAYGEAFTAPFEAGGVIVRAFPGAQKPKGGFIECNVYAVTADGITVTHNGDNQQEEPYRMLADSGIPVDLAIANSWSGFAPYFEAVKPRLAVFGHEQELKHKVAGRDPFVTVFKRRRDGAPAVPVLLIDRGESVTVNRPGL